MGPTRQGRRTELGQSIRRESQDRPAFCKRRAEPGGERLGVLHAGERQDGDGLDVATNTRGPAGPVAQPDRDAAGKLPDQLATGGIPDNNPAIITCAHQQSILGK